VKRRSTTRGLCLAIAGALAFTSACATSDPMHAEFAWEETQAKAASETPLGGQALIHRKRELERAQKDVKFFYQTLTSLRGRRNHSGYMMLGSFMDAYFGLHLGPLLEPTWQSSHPEVMALDVSLRIAEAEMYVQMRDPARAQQVIDDVRSRYEGREGMLVELPNGEQTTVGDAIDSLADRKWWKG
jgi:hypothetical protein